MDLNSNIFTDSVAIGEFSECGASGPWRVPGAGTQTSSKEREPSLLHSTVGRAADTANFSFPQDVDVIQSETISSYLCPENDLLENTNAVLRVRRGQCDAVPERRTCGQTAMSGGVYPICLEILHCD